MNAGIIVAAGLGKRFNNKIPKQFISINGKEILAFSVKTFFNHPKINELIIVCHKKWLKNVKKCYPYCKVVVGGEFRKDSSMNGINAVSNENENVLIHDAARPLISAKIISRCLDQLKDYDATAPILDSTNSLIEIKNNQIKSINRDQIKSVQTPQCFKLKHIKKIFSHDVAGTDEISMVLNIEPNSKINFVQGSIKNLKITNQQDLQIIESFLK